MTAADRGAIEVIRDFHAATSRLARIAADWRESQFRAGDLTDAASTLEGMRALLGELRMMGGAE